MSKLYLVYGDTHFDGYGSYIHVFGIFRTREKAERVKVKKEDEYFKEDQASAFSSLSCRSEVNFTIMEVEVGVPIDECLGGYAE